VDAGAKPSLPVERERKHRRYRRLNARQKRAIIHLKRYLIQSRPIVLLAQDVQLAHEISSTHHMLNANVVLSIFMMTSCGEEKGCDTIEKRLQLICMFSLLFYIL
jgi:hypothetical protein